MNVSDELGQMLASPFGLPPEAGMGVLLVGCGIAAVLVTLVTPKGASASGDWGPKILGLLTGGGGIGIGLLGICLVS